MKRREKKAKNLTEKEKKKILARLLISDMIPIVDDGDKDMRPFKEVLSILRKDLEKIYSAYEVDTEDPYLGYLSELFNPCPCWVMISSYKEKILKKL